MSFGSGSFGSSSFGSGGSAGDSLVGEFIVNGVEYIAEDMIRVYFSEEVVVGTAYLLTSNYSIPNLLVKEVLQPNVETLDYALLSVSPQTVEQTYTITVTGLTSRTGDLLSEDDNTYTWTYNRTKVDSILASIPSVYDKDPDSNLRGLLTAIGMSDNLVGGSPSE